MSQVAWRLMHRPLRPPALYYPYADFQSEAWVKLALLNWNRIERIRPTGYSHEDSPITQRILKSTPGWLKDITPDDWQLTDVGNQFRSLLAMHGHQLQDRYAVDKRSGWPKASFGATPSGADQRLAYVFGRDESLNYGMSAPAKVAYLLQQEFESLGLVRKYKVGRVMWLGFHPQLASVYMCALAEVIADARALVPVTDDYRVHYAAAKSASLARIEKALAGETRDPRKLSRDEVEGRYIEIELRAVLNPCKIDEIPVERILDFRGSHERELLAFQDHVFDLRTDILEICRISDAEELQYRLQYLYESRTEPELKELQRKLNRFGIRCVPGILRLRIDKESITQTIGGIVAVTAAHTLIGAAIPKATPFGIAVATIPYIRRQQQEKKRLKHESPASLLLAVQNELT